MYSSRTVNAHRTSEICITSGDRTPECKGCQVDKIRVKSLALDPGYEPHEYQLNFNLQHGMFPCPDDLLSLKSDTVYWWTDSIAVS